MLPALPLYFFFLGVPPVNFDVLSYHIPIAQRFAAGLGQSVLLEPSTFYERLPTGAFILEAPVVGGDHLSLSFPILLFSTIIASALSLSRIVAWMGGRSFARGLAVTIFMFHPLVRSTQVNLLNDLFVTLFALAAAEFLLMSLSAKYRLWHFLLAGLLAGSAAAVKLSAVGVVCIPIALLAVVAIAFKFRKQFDKKLLLGLFILGSGMLIAFGPWIVRATTISGSPAHPFGGYSEQWTEAQAEFVLQSHEPVVMFSATWFQNLLTKSTVFGFNGSKENPFSVLLLATILAIFLLPGKRKNVIWILLWPAIAYIFWLSMGLNPERFLLPAVSFAIVPAVLLASPGLMTGYRRPVLFILAIVVVVQGLLATRDAFQMPKAYTQTQREEFQAAFFQELTLAAQEADATPGSTLLLFESRPALFAESVVYNTVWDLPPWHSHLRRAADASEFRNLLLGDGITAVLVNEIEWGRLVDFYGGELLREDSPKWMRTGVFNVTPESDAMRAYPPFVFAGFGEPERRILLEFLRDARRKATVAQPPTAPSQVWFAPITN